MVGGSLRVLRLPPPLKLVAMNFFDIAEILLKVALKHKKTQNQIDLLSDETKTINLVYICWFSTENTEIWSISKDWLGRSHDGAACLSADLYQHHHHLTKSNLFLRKESLNSDGHQFHLY
jgi:hypothetical protein